jgi:hypothetical protein
VMATGDTGQARDSPLWERLGKENIADIDKYHHGSERLMADTLSTTPDKARPGQAGVEGCGVIAGQG